ncbi:MAG: OadG family protein [Fusobacterium sp.]|nr:OadG family protein [Fusobacterium sp.]
MWTSNTMTTWESFVTFLVGFSIVFICLLSLALFIIISSKVINAIVKEDKPKTTSTPQSTTNAAAKTPVVKENESEVEELAVIISAISEEMRLPVDKFEIVSVKQI